MRQKIKKNYERAIDKEKNRDEMELIREKRRKIWKLI